ncbi:MAG TPA: hypothetical protein PKC23_05425 [Candidatus Desulfobacillus sp.]|nr:hypothetical protein [Candidatus Desulfobacillus sp.]
MSTAEETADAPPLAAARRSNTVIRLKRLLAFPLLLWQRWQDRREAQPSGEEEASGSADEAAAGAKAELRLLPYAIVLLAGIAAGAGVAYGLTAHALAEQAAALQAAQGETVRLKTQLSGHDKQMLEGRKKFEEEQIRRVEAENRLAIAQADLARLQAGDNPGSAKPAGSGEQASRTANSIDCTLRAGSAGSTLKDCLKAFNGR